MGITALPAIAWSQDKYVYYADLKNIEDDEVAVKLSTPAIKTDEVIFSFPKVIPGSYSEKNFGKYIDDLVGFDKNGNKLKIKKLNPNQYEIKNATELATITYKVNDTWDKADKDFIFQPGGTNIEAGINVIMNNHAFYGYFEDYKMLPFEIHIAKPDFMYASTHLSVERKSPEEDILKADNYVYLADNPVFYCKPDTTSFMAGGSTINVSVFSANGKVKSYQIAGYLTPMATALDKFFNGLPVKSYQFLFYFEDEEKMKGRKTGGGYGALEHNYSSLYFLPEIAFEPNLKSMVEEVSSHEFLHILTPLNLHSEEIENFDFISPKMSKHLWLYEGVTEYFANLVQVQNGLLTEKEFFANMRNKMGAAEKFGNFSLTEMSSHVLEDDYKDKYASVYSKGALTAMMLDIFIREKTGGSKDLKSVIIELTKKYGVGKPFKDDELFAYLVQVSHSEVESFINKYIEGEAPLPYEQMFSIIGYKYSETKKIDAYLVGDMGLIYDEKNKAIAFSDVEKRNALDIKNGDLLASIDGNAVTDENINTLWETYFKRNSTRPNLTITVRRDGELKELSGTLFQGYIEMKNSLEPLPAADPGQTKRLAALLNKA